MSLTHFLIDLSERGLVPDFLIRAGHTKSLPKKATAMQT
jgi:hypothetical protein